MGCESHADHSDPATTKTALVLSDFRDVEQVHGQWQHAHYATDTSRRNYLFQSAVALRGVGSLSHSRYVLNEEGECTPSDSSAGSGLLTSSTRLTTAHHVTASTTAPDGIAVIFESRIAQDGDHSGYVVEDGNIFNDPLVYFDRVYSSYATKFDYYLEDLFENPLLLNRLAQLGIELNHYDARNFLRGPWLFKVEHDEFPAVFTQGRLDVTTLQAQARPLPFRSTVPADDWRYLRSGAFPGRAPGVFFDYRPYQSLSHCPTELDENYSCPEPLEHGQALLPDRESTPLWALHANRYPYHIDDDEDDERSFSVPIVSNPFPFITEDPLDGSGVRKGLRNSDLFSGPASNCVGGVPEPITYGDEFLVTLDAYGGSSGGALLHPHRTIAGNSVRQSPSRIYPHATLVAISGGPLEDLIHYWGHPQGSDLSHLLAVTAASDAVSRRSRYDDASDDEENPGNPTPVQPPGDGEPKCVLFDSEGRECLSYTGGFVNSHFGPISDPLLYLFPTDVPSDEIDAHQGQTEADAAGMGNSILANCGFSHEPFTSEGAEPRVSAGIGVGFIGSLRFDPALGEPDENSLVGYLRMVCTPWASIPFITNWPFLRTVGTSFGQTQNHTGFFPGRFGTLAETLATVGEERYHDGRISRRPLSMKTCPPNYFLGGVTLHSRTLPDESARALGGIRSLRCRVSKHPYNPNDQLPSELTVDLYPQNPSSCSHRLGEFCFSIGQQIGWSQPVNLPSCQDVQSPASCEETIQCPSDEVVQGFAYQRTPDGLITGFGLKCIQEPG